MKKIRIQVITRYFIPVLLCLTLVLCLNTVSAAPHPYVYVNATGGDDDNSGNNWTDAKKTIQNATDIVSNGGTINLANGNYNGTGNTNITINKNMTINGQSQAGTIIDGTGTSWIFQIIDIRINLILQSLTLSNGFIDLGSALYNEGTITANNCTFKNNTADEGGAIYNSGNFTALSCTFGNNSAVTGGAISNYGTMNINDSILENNSADYDGGVIYNEGSFNLTNSIIRNNTGSDGGFIHDESTFTFSQTIITGCTFTNNNGRYGGAIYNCDGNETIIDCTFTDNTADYDGGAIFSDHEITIIKGCTFTNNIATRHGGAIYSDDDPFNAHFNRFYNNTAQNGTAIYCDDCSMNCTNNWWGSNENPMNIPNLIVAIDDGRVYTDPWLIMTFSANPTTITQGQTSTLTASFNINSDGDTVGDFTNHIPDGTPVTFTTDSGKVYTASSGIVNSKSVVIGTLNGVATAILDGDALLTANLDNQTSNATVTINSANVNAASQTTSTGKTIGMQNTGLPIAGLMLAIFALFGGLAVSKRK